jgi:16S rRNA (cytidine1402-2'-O)-methyltransferase
MDIHKKSNGHVYLIPVPIAENTTEFSIPLYHKAIISELDTFFVENIRTARRYISSLKLGLVIEELKFSEIGKTSEKNSESEFLKILQAGNNVGIMSEAGCPGIADPGSRYVEIAHKHNIEVLPLVGPSSIILALMASGMNGQKFCFHGYLPVDKEELKTTLKKIEKDSISEASAQIFIETPYRNESLFKHILEYCNPLTMLCVARDLTSENQFIKTQNIQTWKQTQIDFAKKPAIFILQGNKL